MSEVRLGYKQTEVGVIPEDWEVKSICKVAHIQTGPFGTLLKASEYSLHGGTPLISVREIGEGFIKTDYKTPYVSSEIIKRMPEYVLHSGDIVFGRKGAVDRSALVADEQEGWFLGSDGIRIRLSNSCNSEFVACQLQQQQIRRWLLQHATGTTMPSLNQEVLGRVILALPNLAEQTAITEALSDADALIQSLDQLIAKKRNIKQGAMQELFKTKIDWLEIPLGNVATIIRGASPRPIDSPIWFKETSKIGWVRIADVTKSGRTLVETVQKLSEAGVKNSRFVAKKNLIMSICATVGRPIITEIDVCIHDGFVVFSNPVLNIEYLYYYLTVIENNWSKNGQTGSQMNLNTNLIKSTKIRFPENKEEQTAIANVLSDMDAEIAALEQKRDKYKAIKQGMMQELLTGKIRLV